jgi:hypothetical protein
VPDVDIAAILRVGEAAAFHGPPADGIEGLSEALEQLPTDGPQTGMVRWLLGVCLGAAGRYGESWEALRPVIEGSTRAAGERLTAGLAAACSASMHRQIGQHAEAQALDERGLAWATPLGVPGTEAVLDCAVGHVADAVGLEDLPGARKRLQHAEGLLTGAGEAVRWRARVRLAWVRAEVALLDGDASAAVAAATGAMALSEASAAPRHVVKSQLFLGVAQATAGHAEAVGTLRAAASAAQNLGVLPLVWPARAVLGAVLPPGEESATSLAAARIVVEALAANLPQDVRERWMERPDIAALRQA